MILEIVRSNDEIDTYDINTNGVSLSPHLQQAIDEDGPDDQVIRLPDTFKDQYMLIIEKYFNYFSHEPLPLKLPVPLPEKADISLVHAEIHEWMRPLTLTQLARMVEIAMYFELEALLDQVNAVLAISIMTNAKGVFKQFHEPSLTLTSKDSVSEKFPMFGAKT
jgi:hypothetical protein